MKADIKKLLWKNRFLIAAAVLGIVLLIIAGSAEKPEPADVSEEFDIEAQEKKLAEAISKISGAGDATVILSAEGGSIKKIASDTRVRGDDEENETVIVRSGSSQESPVTVEVVYPKYRGALVVTQGADDPAVRLMIINAVSSLTGLTADRISVVKMK